MQKADHMRDFEVVPRLLGSLFFESAWIKWLVAGLIWVWSFLLPSTQLATMFLCVGVLTVLDTITGVMASRATGAAISSAKAGRMVLKLSVYLISVILVALASHVLPEGEQAHSFLLFLMLASIGYTEVVSNGENLDRMGFPLPKGVTRWLRGRKREMDSAEFDKKD